jgi:hypothetical protein
MSDSSLSPTGRGWRAKASRVRGARSSYTQLGGRVRIDAVMVRASIESDWLSMLFR